MGITLMTDNEGVPEVPSSSKNPPDTPDIDDKVANFLAVSHQEIY
jgi:hypothetical protein